MRLPLAPAMLIRVKAWPYTSNRQTTLCPARRYRLNPGTQGTQPDTWALQRDCPMAFREHKTPGWRHLKFTSSNLPNRGSFQCESAVSFPAVSARWLCASGGTQRTWSDGSPLVASLRWRIKVQQLNDVVCLDAYDLIPCRCPFQEVVVACI